MKILATQINGRYSPLIVATEYEELDEDRVEIVMKQTDSYKAMDTSDLLKYLIPKQGEEYKKQITELYRLIDKHGTDDVNLIVNSPIEFETQE